MIQQSLHLDSSGAGDEDCLAEADEASDEDGKGWS